MKLYKRTASAAGIGFLLATNSLGQAEEAVDYSALMRAMERVQADRDTNVAPADTAPVENITIVEETAPDAYNVTVSTKTPTMGALDAIERISPTIGRIDENTILLSPYAPVRTPELSFPSILRDFQTSHSIAPLNDVELAFPRPTTFDLLSITPRFMYDDLIINPILDGINYGIGQTPTEDFNTVSTPTNFDRPQHIVVDLLSGDTINELHADEQRQPASLVKVMTIWLAMDALNSGALDADTRLPIPSGTARIASGAYGTLNTRNTYSVSYLMNQAGTRSNAYATIALAVGVARAQNWVNDDASTDDAIAAFVDRMNDKARETGMTRTIFGNVTGMRTNYSTPRDMARMFSAVYRTYPEMFVDSMGGTNHTSRFQRSTSDAIGSKTGTLNQCGLCLGSVYNRNGRTYVMVIFGMDSVARRYGYAQNLYGQTPQHYLPTNVPMPVARPVIPESDSLAAGSTTPRHTSQTPG